MDRVFLVGNPNVGKTTLFNSLTKSDEHTGNWHGVTVDAKLKIIQYKNQKIEIIDLPGLYSLNTFTLEEEVTTKALSEDSEAKIIYVIDANTISRNLYLLYQLLKTKINIKVVINNYDYFKQQQGSINIKKLTDLFGCEFVIFDARKIKIDDVMPIRKSKIEFSLNTTEEIYHYINRIIEECVVTPKDFIYGKCKLDNVLLKGIPFLLITMVLVFIFFYLTFFLLGPYVSNMLSIVLNNFIKIPLLNLLEKMNTFSWLYRLIDEGIFSALLTICSFLPQVCMLYIFLTILEESGFIARIAFMSDDILSRFGLNGKCVYTMLMGFGCNTSACYTCKNMSNINAKRKTALVTPFMSCSAKLPIYMTIVSTIIGINNILYIFILYCVGVCVAFYFAYLYEKSLLKSKDNTFIIEFSRLRVPSMKKVMSTGIKTSKQFLSKIITIVLCMSVIVWLLNNVSINFQWTNDSTRSILFFISNKIKWLFKPIGLNNSILVCSLIIGLVAKELILSSMIVLTGASSLAMLKMMMSSGIVLNISIASTISFSLFILLYLPCCSTISVLLKEIGAKWTILGCVLQFVFAYLLSGFIYNIAINNYLLMFIFLVGIILFHIIMKNMKNILCKVKNRYRCNKCNSGLRINKTI